MSGSEVAWSGKDANRRRGSLCDETAVKENLRSIVRLSPRDCYVEPFCFGDRAVVGLRVQAEE